MVVDNVLYLKAQDDRPDEAERERRIAVDNVVRANVLQVHVLLLQEEQRLVDVLQAVDAHFATRRSRQPLARQDLEQSDEQAAVAQVYVHVVALVVADADEVRVDPLGEGLLLHVFALVGQHLDARALEQARRAVAAVEVDLVDGGRRWRRCLLLLLLIGSRVGRTDTVCVAVGAIGAVRQCYWR